MMFEGLPAGKVEFDRIPAPFFSELLPQIDHLGELKLTLYILWRLDRMTGDYRYVTVPDLLADGRFMVCFGASPSEQEAALQEALARCVARGTLLMAEIPGQKTPLRLYFFNAPKGRAAVDAIQRGEWHPPLDEARLPIELTPPRPNIYQLYEENIGLLTPLLAEALGDAQDEFPAKWIEEAFRIAVEKNIRNWRYIHAILRRWQERGYDVPEERRISQEDGSKDFRRYSQGEYADFIEQDD
jgi:DnaD/phage-associated family protein